MICWASFGSYVTKRRHLSTSLVQDHVLTVCAAWTYSVFSWASRAGAASQAGGNIGDGVLSAYGVPVARWAETVRVAAGEDGVFVRYRFHAGRQEELMLEAIIRFMC